MTANQLFAEMSRGLAARILEEVHGTDKELYKVALHAVAQARKVRPVFLERQPKVERHRLMASALALRTLETIAGNVLSGWLVKNQSALLCDFLDTLKIQHQNGVVEDLPKTVADADLENAVNLILSRHDPETAALYLHAFYGMNDANWPKLAEMLNTDTRLMVGV